MARERFLLDEYFAATEQRLRKYPQYLAMLNTAIIKRDTAQAKLGEVSKPISQYGEKTASCTDSLTSPEEYAEAQEQARRDLWRAEKTIVQLRNLVQPISEAFSTLEPEETKVISLRYWGLVSPINIPAFDYSGLKGKKWEEFEDHGFSRRTAIRIGKIAQWKIRHVIFPCRQDEGTGVIAVD